MTHQEIIKLSQEIIRMAREAERFQTWTHDFMMQRLMELVSVSAAAEREECAKLVEIFDRTFQTGGGIAGSIRARGVK